jgi:hypothetical protein
MSCCVFRLLTACLSGFRSSTYGKETHTEISRLVETSRVFWSPVLDLDSRLSYPRSPLFLSFLTMILSCPARLVSFRLRHEAGVLLSTHISLTQAYSLRFTLVILAILTVALLNALYDIIIGRLLLYLKATLKLPIYAWSQDRFVYVRTIFWPCLTGLHEISLALYAEAISRAPKTWTLKR